MKYMLLICTDPKDAPKSAEEGAQLSEEYGKYTQELINASVLVAGDPLHGAETATTVRVRKGETLTSDGPFAETKEHLAGYYIVDVADLDQAIAWAAKIPGAATGSIEVRPVREM